MYVSDMDEAEARRWAEMLAEQVRTTTGPRRRMARRWLHVFQARLRELGAL